LLLAGFAVPSVSHAATITFELTSDECTGGCLTTPSAGTITLTDNTTIGGVDFTLSLNSGYLLITTGLGGDFDIGYHLAGSPTTTFTAFNKLAAPGGVNPQSANSRQFDGIGPMDYGLACAACGQGSAGVGGTFSVHISDVTTASFIKNTSGEFFGVDIYSINTGNTGAVDASVGVTNTPEPSTVILYGLGLTMLIVGQKWRKSREISANLN
jgi:hypothetical protein